MSNSLVTVADVNALDQAAFVERLGFVFEGSPWIMAETWAARPFAGRDDLHAKAVAVVNGAPRRRQIALILAHPDLVGQAALAGTLTPESSGEQAAAGIDPGQLTPDEITRFTELNAAYKERFGFPFVICARDHDKVGILTAMAARSGNDEFAEVRAALAEIAKIARYRLIDAVEEDPAPAARTAQPAPSGEFDYEVSYGKSAVPVYRVNARPLRGIAPIPESAFSGRENTLFAMEVDVEVIGDTFLPAYTQGDNSMVVATDSMKNLMIQEALNFEGATREGYLAFLGETFLRRYQQMQTVRMTGREIPFVAAQVPDGSGGFGPSNVLFDRGRGEYAVASLLMTRSDQGTETTEARSGLRDLMLMKTTGSSFTAFVRDDYTTLPERHDRPLYIHLDLHWRYGDVADLLDLERGRYVPAEQVRDLVRTVFHEFVSESIQHLQHEMGQRLLARFPQIDEVSFHGKNLTRDPWGTSETDPSIKVYSDPFNAFGVLTLTMRRR